MNAIDGATGIRGATPIAPMSADGSSAPSPMSLAERVRGMREGLPRDGNPVPGIDSPTLGPSPGVGEQGRDDSRDSPPGDGTKVPDPSDIWRALFVRQLWLEWFDGYQERCEEIADV